MKESKEFRKAYKVKQQRFKRVFMGCVITVDEEGLPVARYAGKDAILDYPMCRQALRYILQKQGEVTIED